MLIDPQIDNREIAFRPDGHIYTVKGKVTRSTTQVLSDAGISDFSRVPKDVLQYAQDRGTAVHRAIHYELEDDLDLSTVAPEIEPYLIARRKFMVESGFVPELIEHIVYCPRFDYIGMLDVKGLYRCRDKTVLDWKTGDETEAWGPQLASYVQACVGPYACYGYRRLVVRLKKDATFKLYWYPFETYRKHFDTFLWALGESRRKLAMAV